MAHMDSTGLLGLTGHDPSDIEEHGGEGNLQAQRARRP